MAALESNTDIPGDPFNYVFIKLDFYQELTNILVSQPRAPKTGR